MRLRFLAAFLPALALAPAAAAEPRPFAFEEVATDAAYGFCPLFLAGNFPLTAPALAERGFSATIEKQAHAQGELQLVTAKRPEGEIGFGGVAGKVCVVVVNGERRAATLASLRAKMSWMGLSFAPAPHQGALPAGMRIEAFKAPVEDQMLNVQLIETGGEAPTVTAQLFATDK